MLPLLSWNSLSRPGWTETHKDLPAKCWIRGVLHHGPASQTFFTLGGMSSSGALTWPWLMFALMQRRWPEPEYSAAPEREERSFLKSENKAMQPGLELCRSDSTCFLTDKCRTNRTLTPFPEHGRLPRSTGCSSSKGVTSCSNSALIGFRGFRRSNLALGLAVRHSSTHWACAGQGGKEGASGKMAAASAGVGRLEEEALRRKERLKALREKTGRKGTQASELCSRG
ncbi:coiled-coil domain-containing protein 12 isoform X2 [Meriones unguiculatus]|uniref:coiled-coil domain-containing protein 12 isoform X2 n=1 Tax=Meriones unguiculatus TaxID=10047 RepID=UPI00293F35CF|nr:coiled-coil domain-containing protein 12 isoform X2 [Meriones unguiculatus]